VSRGGRGLTPEEAAVWARVASTVTPLDPARRRPAPPAVKVSAPRQGPVIALPAIAPAGAPPNAAPPRPLGAHGLDTNWDRKLARGQASPDFTLDLHGCTLDAAHSRLLHGLAQAKAMGARLVLLVTGRPRPADPADRMSRRGAIRAKVIDWLAASEHAHDIAAIRGAHPRHGGQGALYIVLKRRR
jgi:DNA-nicking Smr family endonuclease